MPTPHVTEQQALTQTVETPVLQVSDLRTVFDLDTHVLAAVDGISFSLGRGEILALVGESGSGKSITGFSIMGLIDPPGRVACGSVLFDGRDLVGLPDVELRHLRGNRIAMIFQDPMMTLNPVLRIDTQMVEAVQAHHDVPRSQALDLARDALDRVGMPAPEARLNSYPHQLSGGMRQRVAIAIALLNRPDIVIADEPTTALDVTIQGQILFQVQKLVEETGTALIWITHDLSVIAEFADQVAVMYAGRIIEHGTISDVITAPAHPYTRGLIDSVPARNRRGDPLAQIRGQAPSLSSVPTGCPFRPRCDRTSDRCAEDPRPEEIAPRHWVRCHHPYDEGSAAP